MASSKPSVIGFDMQSSKKSLSKAEAEWTKPMISIRKMLTTNSVECSLMGNLHGVNQIQFAEPVISGTILVKAT